MKNKKLKKEILKISEGVVATVTDIILLLIFYGLEAMINPPTPSGARKARKAAYKDWEHLDYEIIKRTIYRLKKKGLIQYAKETLTRPRITTQGRKRLEAILPFYDKKRVWNGKLYLVTYDIPKKQKSSRERLRYYLKKIGCGRLQNSVWITPYNPQEVLEEFIKRNNLEGAVIISSIGDKESVGKESLRELVARVYNLDELHGRYLDFNLKYHRIKKFKPRVRLEIISSFLSILKNDPQLPFKLLPPDWAGTEAYQIFQRALRAKVV